MRKILIAISLLFSATVLSAADDDYGLVESKPVKVGGSFGQGVGNSRAYLSRLRGPNGEVVSFERFGGSCCPFKTPNALIGDSGLLDRYKVTYSGLAQPIIIYINFYDKAEVYPVKGLKFDTGSQ